MHIDGNLLESVDKFIYLRSFQSSDGYCRPYLNRRIGFASSTTASLGRIWKDKRLTEATKIRLYQALVLSVLMYAADTWRPLAADTGTRSLSREMSTADPRCLVV